MSPKGYRMFPWLVGLLVLLLVLASLAPVSGAFASRRASVDRYLALRQEAHPDAIGFAGTTVLARLVVMPPVQLALVRFSLGAGVLLAAVTWPSGFAVDAILIGILFAAVCYAAWWLQVRRGPWAPLLKALEVARRESDLERRDVLLRGAQKVDPELTGATPTAIW
jgi:hypothetical protein